MKKRNWIWIILVLIFLIAFILLLSVKIHKIDLSSHGHGDIKRGFFSSLFTTLGITENPDYIDDFGESYCFNDDCWDNAEEEYDACCGDEIIPFGIPIVYIGGGIFGGCSIECEEEYQDTLINECSERCEEEVYTWDGTPVNNLGEFSRTAFPNFMRDSESMCESFVIGGTWVSNQDKVGCEDSTLMFCDTNSLTSAGEVCETIGYTWECSLTGVYCEK